MLSIYHHKPITFCGKGGVNMKIFNFLISIVASVISYYICKWFDKNNGND